MSLKAISALLAPPLCWGCGARTPGRDPLCRGCRGALRWLGPAPALLAGVEVWAPVAYEGPARAVVRGLKFGRAAGLAEPLAAQMAAGAPAGWLDAGTTFVPVPLDRARQRSRGFNQAQRLASSLARRTGLTLSDCLVRDGPARRQAGRGRADRLATPPRFRLRAGSAAPSAPLLVDDVATTGATLAACADALRAGGCTSVKALAYARTPGR